MEEAIGLCLQAGVRKKHLRNPNELGAGIAPAPASLEVMHKANKSNRIKKKSAFQSSCCLLRAAFCCSGAGRKDNNPQLLQIQIQETPAPAFKIKTCPILQILDNAARQVTRTARPPRLAAWLATRSRSWAQESLPASPPPSAASQTSEPEGRCEFIQRKGQ